MSTTLDEFDEDEDEECACEDGSPGCWPHYRENGGYDGDSE